MSSCYKPTRTRELRTVLCCNWASITLQVPNTQEIDTRSKYGDNFRMTSRCNLHVNNVHSVNTIKSQSHLGLQTELVMCYAVTSNRAECVKLRLYTGGHQHARSHGKTPYVYATCMIQLAGADQNCYCHQIAVNTTSAWSVIYVFWCKCFVPSVTARNSCWRRTNSRFSAQRDRTDACHDSSEGVLSYWLADRGTVAWSQHWQGICTDTKPSKPFVVRSGFYWKSPGVSYPG